MSFFVFRQNNSGGVFLAPAVRVVVEADTPYEANKIAQEHGVYFDGDGDCSCCGNRWYAVSALDAEDTIPEPYEHDHYFADDDDVPVTHLVLKNAPAELEPAAKELEQ